MKNISAKTFIIIIITRIILNLSYRILYPFLPAISRGLGVSFEQGALLVSVRSLAGLVSPFFGSFFDKRGHKFGMLWGIAILTSGSLMLFISSSFWIAFAVFALFGLAKAVYDPSVQAYVSSLVPYHFRAKAMGIIELSWSGSWFIGIPVAALLIDTINWKAPFVLIGAISAIMFLFTLNLPEFQNTPKQAETSSSTHSIPRKSFLILAMSFFMMLSNENVIVVYGAWMEQTFGIKLVSLGFISLIIGMGELTGELAVTLAGDKIGKQRLLLMGLTGLALSYIALPLIAKTIVAATAGLIIMFFFSELSIVVSFPYISEISPQARAKILSANYASAIGGRLMGSFTGPWLWHFFSNIHTAATISFVCVVLSLSFLLFYLHVSSVESKKHKFYE